MSVDVMRQAVIQIEHDIARGEGEGDSEFLLAVAEWLRAEAEKWTKTFRSVQEPPMGIDQPPAIHHDDPKAAAACADHHARYALAVAYAYLHA